MQVRFYIDPKTREPHIYNHGVTEEEIEDEVVAEDEAAFEDSTQTVMEVPNELVPVVRELIAKHRV